MYYQSLIDLFIVTIAYIALFVGYPWIVFSPMVEKKTKIMKFFIYLIMGHLVVIASVFLLSFFGMFNQVSLILLLIFTGIIIRYNLSRVSFVNSIIQMNKTIYHLFSGEYGFKLYFYHKYISFKLFMKNIFYQILGVKRIEHIIFIILLACNGFYYIYNSLKYVSYGAPDEEVHLFWIQSIIKGDIYPSGVYPHGFHAVFSALSTIFNLDAVSIVNIAGVLIITLILITLFNLLNKVLVIKELSLIGIIIFVFFNIYSSEAISRFQYSVPQEYGIIVIVPMIFFLIDYLENKRTLDLAFFGLSFALTLTFHFYTTIIAFLICLAVGFTYITHIFKQKLFFKIILCGILSTIIGLSPMFISLGLGFELEQSMDWARSVIAGDIYGEDELEETTVSTIIEDFKIDVKDHVINQLFVFYLMLIIIAANILFCIINLRRDRANNKYRYQMFYDLILVGMIMLMMTRSLNLPTLMETKRVAIFYSLFSIYLFAVPFDMIIQILDRKKLTIIILVVMIAIAPLLFLMLTDYDMLKKTPSFYYIQTKGAMKMNEHLIETYEKYKWTVVSPVNDISSILNDGYHFELYDFILEQENWNEEIEIEIPTKYVFFYIEKKPIKHYGFRFVEGDPGINDREYINKAKAQEEIPTGIPENQEYQKYRDVLMAKAYYWAKEYQKYFPEEMIVYYEDEEIIIYKMTQNEFSLNNFAINYGFNK